MACIHLKQEGIRHAPGRITQAFGIDIAGTQARLRECGAYARQHEAGTATDLQHLGRGSKTLAQYTVQNTVARHEPEMHRLNLNHQLKEFRIEAVILRRELRGKSEDAIALG